jgi:hypothetical protein
VEIDLGTGTCRVLSLDALIAAKAAMGRPKDQEVIKQLNAIGRHQGRQGTSETSE